MSDTRGGVNPGFVMINGQQHWCGIRVLTKKEAVEQNEGLPFYQKDLEQIIQNTKTRPNVRRLAENIFDLQQEMISKNIKLENYSDKHATTSHQEGNRPQPIPESNNFFTQFPPTTLNRGDIISYASEVQKKYPGAHIAVLNPANRTHMGGGAFIGANALEEIYFRCSNLVLEYVKHAWEVGEALGNDGFVYTAYPHQARPNYIQEMKVGEAWFTPKVTFTHCPSPDGYKKLEEPLTVSVIGSTAKIYSTVEAAKNDKDNEQITKKEIRAQLNIAIKNKVDIPILTAFGCGAFNNDPELVAKCYWEVLYKEGYAAKFQHIEFAIWSDPNPDKPQNFEPFDKVFKALNQKELAASITQSPGTVFIKFNTFEEAQKFYIKYKDQIPVVSEMKDGNKIIFDNPDSIRCYPQYAVRIPINMKDYKDNPTPFVNFAQNNPTMNLPALSEIPHEPSRNEVIKKMLVDLIMDKYWDDKKPSGGLGSLFGGVKPPDAIVEMRKNLHLPADQLIANFSSAATSAIKKHDYGRHEDVKDLYSYLKDQNINKARELLERIHTPKAVAPVKEKVETHNAKPGSL